MGNNFNYSNDNFDNSINKSESEEGIAPEFYLNKNFPNHYNLSIEEVIQNILKSKYDLLENKQLTASLSKEFKLLFSINSILSNNSLEKINKQEKEENDSKNLLINKKLSQSNLDHSILIRGQENNNFIINNEKLIKEENIIKSKEKNSEDIKSSKKDSINKMIDICLNKEENKNDILIKKIKLDSSNNFVNNNIKKEINNKKKFFLSDYNIYSCNENSNDINNINKIVEENANCHKNNKIYINNGSNNNVNNENENNIIEKEENENLFDNLSNKTDYNKIKGRKNEIKEENRKKEYNEKEISGNKNQKEEDKNKKKKKLSSKNMNKFNIKRKYTEFEPNLITTKAASLMKDIRKEYKFKNCIGGGHFGTVRKAYKKTDNAVITYSAIKSIPMKNLSNNIDDFVKEVDIISTLDHPNIIKFYETYHD